MEGKVVSIGEAASTALVATKYESLMDTCMNDQIGMKDCLTNYKYDSRLW